jgi:hypothetical protein
MPRHATIRVSRPWFELLNWHLQLQGKPISAQRLVLRTRRVNGFATADFATRQRSFWVSPTPYYQRYSCGGLVAAV